MFSTTILSLPDAAQELVLADHRPRRLNQRRQPLEGAAAEPYRLAVGQDPKTALKQPNSAIAGGVAEANYRR